MSGDRQVCALPKKSCFVYLNSKLSMHAELLAKVSSRHHGWFLPCNKMFITLFCEQPCGWQLCHFGRFPVNARLFRFHVSLCSPLVTTLCWHGILCSPHCSSMLSVRGAQASTSSMACRMCASIIGFCQGGNAIGLRKYLDCSGRLTASGLLPSQLAMRTHLT